MKLKIEALAFVCLSLAVPACAEVVQITVTSRAETAPMAGDADDPAIWDGAVPRIIGTDKTAGLRVYDLSGALLQSFDDGALNNVDLRDLGGFGLIGASKREDDTMVFYMIDAAGMVSRASPFAFPAAFPGIEVDDVYGFAMGRDAKGPFALVNFKTGHVFQWHVAQENGQIRLTQGGMWQVPTQPEGMVVDDLMGHVYVGEEDFGIWRLPLAGGASEKVAEVGSPCLPRDDVEGLAIHDAGTGPRYLVASAQGVDQAAIFAMTPEGLTCTAMVAVAKGDLDGVSETDGLATSARALPGYPAGILVMMDDQNEGFSSNFKIVSWSDIAGGLGR